jgi:hypothetical protein
MVSCLASFFYKMCSEAFDTTTIMNSKSSSMSTVCSLVLLALDFFCNVGFVGETFIFLDGSTSSGRLCGSVTSPCFYLYSSPLFSSLSASSSPPPLGDSEAVSFDVLFSFCTSFVFFLLLVPGVSYSSRVATKILISSGSGSFAESTGIRRYACHSLVISSRSSSVRL